MVLLLLLSRISFVPYSFPKGRSKNFNNVTTKINGKFRDRIIDNKFDARQNEPQINMYDKIGVWKLHRNEWISTEAVKNELDFYFNILFLLLFYFFIMQFFRISIVSFITDVESEPV